MRARARQLKIGPELETMCAFPQWRLCEPIANVVDAPRPRVGTVAGTISGALAADSLWPFSDTGLATGSRGQSAVFRRL
jgi:hypothetical protein